MCVQTPVELEKTQEIYKMRIFVVVLLTFAFTSAQVKDECDIPQTCSDSDLDDQADFDATVEFPEKEYMKEVSGNETVGNIVAAYTPADRIRDVSILLPNWYNTCPSYYYTIYRWSFFDSVHGRCYVITPIRATRCASRYCRYFVVNNPFQKYYRCFPYYRRVYFWAYCPFSQTSRFIITYRYVPGGCNCRRYLCPAIVSVA